MTDSRPSPHTLTTLRRDAIELPGVRVTLVPAEGREETRTLRVEPLVVGTSPDCDLVVSDARVSRRHCALRMSDRGVVLRDLGSKNGTFVDGVEILEVVLAPGSTVTIGNSKLKAQRLDAPSLVPLSAVPSFGGALGGSVVMRALFSRLEQAAKSPETVLLLGESGTGKELLARAIHDVSPRKDGPFVVFDCAAVPQNLAEAELFGYMKGAFTGAVQARAGLIEESHGGTLFIDEIGELPLELQPKLLRALEARQVRRLGSSEWRQLDTRVVAATHRDLVSRIAAGAFREDLYYRLAVVEAHVPPLRERKDDIPLLVERFLAAQSPPRALDQLPPNTLAMLTAHDWPGNVRELRNVVARLVLFPDLQGDAIPSAAGRAGGAPTDLAALVRLGLRDAREMVIEHFERAYLEAKLREHAGNVVRAAEAMGISRALAYRLLARYGLRTGEGP
jgi:transcriptional regulator with PAS, ATPase and Fis domain